MSSEAINSTTPAKPATEEQVFTIEGKDYKRSELNSLATLGKYNLSLEENNI